MSIFTFHYFTLYCYVIMHLFLLINTTLVLYQTELNTSHSFNITNPTITHKHTSLSTYLENKNIVFTRKSLTHTYCNKIYRIYNHFRIMCFLLKLCAPVVLFGLLIITNVFKPPLVYQNKSNRTTIVTETADESYSVTLLPINCYKNVN